MNEKIKTDWVAALRSGNYKQGTGALRTKDGLYCCLGVLSDLYCKEHPEVLIADDLMNQEWPWVDVYEWAGINAEEDVHITLDDLGLADQNDGGVSFNDIATIIEEQL